MSVRAPTATNAGNMTFIPFPRLFQFFGSILIPPRISNTVSATSFAQWSLWVSGKCTPSNTKIQQFSLIGKLIYKILYKINLTNYLRA